MGSIFLQFCANKPDVFHGKPLLSYFISVISMSLSFLTLAHVYFLCVLPDLTFYFPYLFQPNTQLMT